MPNTAQDLLSNVESTQASVQRQVGNMFVPLILFGAVTLLSAPVVWVAGAESLFWFWLIAAPAAGLLNGAIERRRESHAGFRTNPLPSIAIAVLLVISCFAAAAWGVASGHDVVVAAGPALAIALGYLAFALLYRSRLLALVAVGLALSTLMLAATISDLRLLMTVLAVLYGSSFMATGYFMKKKA